MDKVIRKDLYMDEGTVRYVKQYQAEHHLRAFTAALLTIISEHKRLSHLPTVEILEGVEENHALLKRAVELLEVRQNEET
ncbi:MAG TPA: hypothetical protein DEP60_05650 [Ruminococcaceae bacterium]|jgi:uncharacterized protein (UPF0305 family)|nr:hypothetical protein [Oscillospiraceae bacterium]